MRYKLVEDFSASMLKNTKEIKVIIRRRYKNFIKVIKDLRATAIKIVKYIILN